MTDCCIHELPNVSDDYAGRECCICAGASCEKVTPQHQASHDAALLSADPSVIQYTHQAQVLIGAVEEYEEAHPKGAPCFSDALESMRQRAAS